MVLNINDMKNFLNQITKVGALKITVYTFDLDNGTVF